MWPFEDKKLIARKKRLQKKIDDIEIQAQFIPNKIYVICTEFGKIKETGTLTNEERYFFAYPAYQFYPEMFSPVFINENKIIRDKIKELIDKYESLQKQKKKYQEFLNIME